MNSTTRHPPYRPRTGSAKTGDVSDRKRTPNTYHIGSGFADIGDGYDPNYLNTHRQFQQEGDYSVGAGSEEQCRQQLTPESEGR
jgi:hypothetical protein